MYVFSIFTGEIVDKKTQKYKNIIKKIELLSSKNITNRSTLDQYYNDIELITKKILYLLPNTFTVEDIKLPMKEFVKKRVANKSNIKFNMLPRIYLNIIRSKKVKKIHCIDGEDCYQKI